MSYPALEKLRQVTDRNVLAIQEAKAAGKKVVGQFCIYTPVELALAAGAIPVSLCGTRNDSIPAAEAVLPRSLCPLIKSSFGFLLQDSCPYLAASDIVVADTTCDGKKKMYELLAERKPLFLLQLPQTQTPDAVAWWRAQYEQLIARFEQDFGVTITEAAIWQAISVMNRQRRALKRVLDSACRRPAPLSGMEMLELAFRISFLPDKAAAADMLNALADEIEASPMPSTSPNAPRVLLTGVPVGLGSHKVVTLLESCGAAVVCLDNCSCYKNTRLIMPESLDSPDSPDALATLAATYLDMPCAIMTPNPRRYEAMADMCSRFGVDAVVDLTWQGCQPYDVESWPLKRFVREELHLPFLQIVTDYSEADTEQLKVRIEAFLEMLR